MEGFGRNDFFREVLDVEHGSFDCFSQVEEWPAIFVILELLQRCLLNHVHDAIGLVFDLLCV